MQSLQGLPLSTVMETEMHDDKQVILIVTGDA